MSVRIRIKNTNKNKIKLFKKSGLMHFLPLQPRTKNYSDLSDEICMLDNNYDGTLVWHYNNETSITLPLVSKYKYLGIYINRNISFKDHLEFLKKKLDFIANSFLC